MLIMKQLLFLLLLPITGWALQCRVCDKDKKEFKWRNGLQGGQCKKNDEGRLVDFGKKGKKYKDVSCLLFTDGERTWRGVINKIIPDKCYYHGPSFWEQRMYCICNTDDCNNKNACDCSTCKHPELSCPVFERKRIEVPDAVTLEIDPEMMRIEKPIVSKPKFYVDTDRSLGNIPSVTVTFPDGYQDTLKLRQFFTNENEKSVEEANACAYIGNLENERTACVAMTGCYGKEDVQFTILSKHAEGSVFYKWTKNGDVHVIESLLQHKHSNKPSERNGTEVTQRQENLIFDEDVEIDENDVGLDLIFQELCDRNVDWICAIYNDDAKQYNQNSNCVQKSHTLEYKVVYDDDFHGHFGAYAGQKIQQYMALVQPFFCHTSLGTKIKLQRVGEMKHMQGQRWPVHSENAIGNSWSEITKWAIEERGEADTLIALTLYHSGPYLGVGMLNSVCQKDYSFNLNACKANLDHHSAETIAHELGHNLGMYHDFSQWPFPPHLESGCDNMGLMSYGQNHYRWSECSKNDFVAHYTRNRYNWCMPEAENVCGIDGISGCDPTMSKGKGGWWKVDENGECTAIEETGHEIHTVTW